MIVKKNDTSRDTCYIAALDMATDTFGIISMPMFDNGMFLFWSLELLGGYIAVTYANVSAQIHVYTMRESKAE